MKPMARAARVLIRARPRVQRLVVDRLFAHGPATQTSLTASTRLSRPTLRNVLTALQDDGLVETAGEAATARAGRRPVVYRLTQTAGVAVGVDVGRRHLRVVIADGSHRPIVDLEPVVLEAPTSHEPRAVVGILTDLIRRTWAEIGTQPPIIGIGIGLSGPVTRSDAIGVPSLLTGWSGAEVRDELAVRLGEVPVHLDNVAQLGALGEFRFGAQGKRCDLFYMKLGRGIGGGMIIDGRLYRGTAGTAGEIGHVTIDHRGELCRCGNRGCLELFAGGRTLVAKARDAGLDVSRTGQLVEHADRGDAFCRRLIAEAGEYVGIALGAAANLYNPERIVLGGSLSAAGDLLVGPLRMALANSGLTPAVDAVEIEIAHLGAAASAWGGVALAIDEFTSTP